MKNIYVDDKGKGFPLILVHGYLGSSEMWCYQKNYFSNFSDEIIFEASDISEEIAQNIKNNYKNINCYCVDLSNLEQLSNIVKRCNLIVAFGGLQYLLPRDLENFFKLCKKEKAEIIISQPFDLKISPFNIKKSIYRGSFS